MKKTESLALPVIHKGQIPLAFLNTTKSHEKGVVLAGEIGGTKTNLALFQIKDGVLILLKEKSYPTKKYKSFMDIFHAFHKDGIPTVNGIWLGVAGPVTQGKVYGTNFPWEIYGEEIGRELH